MQKKATITGDVLKGKATELWDRPPQFDGLDKPKWSNGWLDGFKKSFNIKEYVQHGEAASADINNPERLEPWIIEENWAASEHAAGSECRKARKLR